MRRRTYEPLAKGTREPQDTFEKELLARIPQTVKDAAPAEAAARAEEAARFKAATP
eukprot:CAMPEP_0119282494 /NCGR_PEP_ID=MMETSP1329-20130426/26815_1 /TAXON_ID=114041 /ORGANISM="Genus nov. species nov., Strain RCC1024" /LENGTH=55 /DNA_ID=CAMNT_0007283151 /DNA_START=53 /DNA_END=217 /DNA_ORIENTATION=+